MRRAAKPGIAYQAATHVYLSVHEEERSRDEAGSRHRRRQRYAKVSDDFSAGAFVHCLGVATGGTETQQAKMLGKVTCQTPSARRRSLYCEEGIPVPGEASSHTSSTGCPARSRGNTEPKMNGESLSPWGCPIWTLGRTGGRRCTLGALRQLTWLICLPLNR